MDPVFKDKKIAIVCDWLTNMGGAEKVILSFHKLFPEADIFTTLYDKQRMKGFENATIFTSFLQSIPYSQKKHPWFLNAMPLAVESFDLNKYDIVISSSHSVAKGVITKPETIHFSYCHTPMRYAWEPWELNYRLKKFPQFLHNSIKKKIHKLRIWDRLCADRVDHFIVNSNYIAQRVQKYYRRDSKVIHPPIETSNFSISEKEDYFLMVGRLISYKKFDLVIEAFNKNGKKLKIAGTGPDETKLKKLANKNVDFLGRVSDEELKKLYSGCQAMIFPQLEDFGITPVECMASGRPVIAYSQGGAKDTVVDHKTGLFFHKQNIDSLDEALQKFEKMDWDSSAIRQHSQSFSEERFHNELIDFIKEKVS